MAICDDERARIQSLQIQLGEINKTLLSVCESRDAWKARAEKFKTLLMEAQGCIETAILDEDGLDGSIGDTMILKIASALAAYEGELKK